MFSLKNKKKIVSELSLSPIIIWSFVEKLRYLCKYIHRGYFQILFALFYSSEGVKLCFRVSRRLCDKTV